MSDGGHRLPLIAPLTKLGLISGKPTCRVRQAASLGLRWISAHPDGKADRGRRQRVQERSPMLERQTVV